MGGASPAPPGVGVALEALEPARRSHRPLGDIAFQWLSAGVAVSVLAALAVLIALLTLRSELAFTAFGPGFLRGATWNANARPPLYGAAPFVEGTLVTSAIGLALGVPVSLGVAVFMSELAPAWLRDPMASLVEMLAAVPSVIYGLWGLFVLVPFMRGSVEPGLRGELGWTGLFSGQIFGADKLTAGIILAIMVIPTISAVSREAMVAVPTAQREAALSLGATSWETTRLGVLRYARSGIVAAVILGLGRAIGETMAVTMTIGNNNHLTASLLNQGNTIASWIANDFLTAATTPLEQSALLELGLVLLAITVGVNVFAELLLGRFFRPEEARE
ncbi:MAG TPA: phosphate ABC transporter permease subunit PstC [Thermoplasmata archaeon]|nr:phosphate ABC transporter permease subunit PstC [Thermoplasmata archaeon]